MVIRSARCRAGLTLRQLAARAATSHSALVAYESGRKSPRVVTLDRIVEASGFDQTVTLTRRAGDGADDRGRELLEVLELAAQFPARHARALRAPVFGRL